MENPMDTARPMTRDEIDGLDAALTRILTEATPGTPAAPVAPATGRVPRTAGRRITPTDRAAPAPAAPAHPAPAQQQTPVRVAARPVAQGDLLFVPVPDTDLPHWAQPVTGSVDLIATGNGHRLTTAAGTTRHATIHGHRHIIGIIHVTGTAQITQPRGHDAHTPLTLGPGTWAVRQQTETVPPLMTPEQIEAGSIRRVFD